MTSPEDRDRILRAAGVSPSESSSYGQAIEPEKANNDDRVNRALLELYDLELIEHWHIVAYLNNADQIMNTAFLSVYLYADELKHKADQRDGWERLSVFVISVAQAYTIAEKQERLGKIYLPIGRALLDQIEKVSPSTFNSSRPRTYDGIIEAPGSDSDQELERDQLDDNNSDDDDLIEDVRWDGED